MNIKVATNLNATKISPSQPMNADFVSDVIDFKEMAVGSIHYKWEGNDAFDAKVYIEASDIPEDGWFTPIKGSSHTLDEDGTTINADGTLQKKVNLFNLGVIGYRYARAVYKKGTNTSGTITFIGMGKKNG